MDKAKLLEGLKKIKEAFGTAEKFVDAKLIDGVTVIRYNADALAIGVPVMVITEQGEMTIPDGDYELVDGTKMTTINGLVSTVEMVKEPKENDMPVDATKAPAPASEMTEAKAKSIIESVIREQRFVTEDMLTEALTKVNSTKETFEAKAKDEVKGLKEQVSKQESVIKQMFELIEKLADEPKVEKTEKVKKAFSISEWKKEYKQDLQSIEKNINN